MSFSQVSASRQSFPVITSKTACNMSIIDLLKLMDGSFNVADVVLLQKWLLAVPNTHLPNWKAADLCEDDKLNVFDLCLMKRALLEQKA